MTLGQLITVADDAYPDGLIMQHWDAVKVKNRPRKNSKAGDTLALFIVQELSDTFNPAATPDDQAKTASTAIERAAAELTSVSTAISAWPTSNVRLTGGWSLTAHMAQKETCETRYEIRRRASS